MADPKNIPREFRLAMAMEKIDEQATQMVQVAGFDADDVANLYVQGAAKAMQLAGYDFDRIKRQIMHAAVCWIHLQEQEAAMASKAKQ